MRRMLAGRVPQGLFECFLEKDQRALLRDLGKRAVRKAEIPVSSNPLWVFVLLQYRNAKVSMECVERIRKNCAEQRHEIVIVDNGSSDGAGHVIRECYDGASGIHVVLRADNEGFARGNNAGYAFAKKRLGADFIVVINNDVRITDEHFLRQAHAEYRRRAYSILCPDMVLVESGFHQNPYRFTIKTEQEVLQSIDSIETRIQEAAVGGFPEEDWRPFGRTWRPELRLEGSIVPHGAAYVFSPIFVSDFEKPFDERTFLYGEEDILALRAYARGHRILYSPKVGLEHLAQASRDKSNQHYAEFRYQNAIASARVYLDVLEEVLGESPRNAWKDRE
jgi:GT2 family glycosyltransferase